MRETAGGCGSGLSDPDGTGLRPDADVVQWLRWFTLMDREQIDALAGQHEAEPHRRLAQTSLARHMTELVHGPDELKRVETATAALFGKGDLRELDEATLAEVFADVPHSTHDKAQLAGDGASLVEVLAETSLATSKRAAREQLGSGAISVNGVKCPADRRLTTADLLPGATILLRRGKKHWHATKWE